ncbi:MarR family winged helix-turn-helix transcriptional regulator [Crossiella cryophila]|uniref:DNA-binding MarR family transcriptional regulator n=1 Tax=Crossiella cryophila TaxID=43355 RepID=A0A7W7C6L2_9PSEU|nr:MarR family transcriptional regulator [Crossiella cryophila]MBB4675478.1 DNA-binding MarR family transcriptional regulator [Crossiella cryophila]
MSSESATTTEGRSAAAVTLGELGRELSAVTLAFHAAAAERMGLSGTDHKCLDLAMHSPGPLTAGRIAELSGLSTGAVTGVIDRLERGGFVRRVRDPHDRRKVLVEVTTCNEGRYDHIFHGLIEGVTEIVGRYRPEEVEVIVRYTRDSIDLMRAQIARLHNLS